MTQIPPPDTGSWDISDPGFYILTWGTLDRYLLKALWMPFLFGVSAFLGISLTLGSLFDLLRQVSEKGLPLSVAVQVLGLKVPSFLALALPMAMLLACLVVYNRLARTNEITAFRSLGVSAIRLAVPGLLLGLWVTFLTFALGEFVVPAANFQAGQLMDRALHEVRPAFRDKNIFYREFERDSLSRVFYARRFDGDLMQDLTVLSFTQGMLTQILVTEAAHWNPASQVWDLLDGTAYALSADAQTYQAIDTFERTTLPLSRAPLDLATETRSADEMSIVDTYDYWRLIKGTGEVKYARQLAVRLQTKLSFPFICVVFALVGAALGLQQRQRSSSKGFGLSLAIIFGYYTVSFIARSLGEAGVLSIFIAAWLPTIAGFLIGGRLLYQANR
ncbi:LptF/LptG family permease [Altericista sp. CCNU0014]|uniref:LptF/LptG family permease n=1 Tax=Altericista sp. CCNU0014 TaxID=3082949 RepID=UPI0038515B21